MFGALRDCVLPLKQARHDPPEVMLDAFDQEISKHFDEVKVFMVDENRVEQCCTYLIINDIDSVKVYDHKILVI